MVLLACGIWHLPNGSVGGELCLASTGAPRPCVRGLFAMCVRSTAETSVTGVDSLLILSTLLSLGGDLHG